MDIIIDIILDAVLDTLKLVPFLFFAYLALEFVEHKAGDGMQRFLRRAGKCGPLLGAGLGLVPQCGFSTASAGLYAARMISAGTVVAVFLATSDEMLPVMLGGRVSWSVILAALGIKLVAAIAVGFAVDGVLRLFARKTTDGDGHDHVHDLCETEHCHCERGIFVSALIHTAHIVLFIFLVELALGGLIAGIGEERLAAFAAGHGVLAYLTAALVGMIPNCAASVVLTDLYVEGVISFGTMMAGLLPGAGAGMLVLLRQRRPLGGVFALLAVLFAVGVLLGAGIDGLASLFALTV